MRLQVENIALVEKADIALDEISVVAGHNGTGKSSVSKALYTICKTKRGLSEKVEEEKIRSLEHNFQRRFQESVDKDPMLRMLSKEFYFVLNNVIREKLGDVRRVYKRACKKDEVYDYVKNMIPEIGQGMLLDTIVNHIVASIEEIEARPSEDYINFIAQRNVKEIFRGQAKNVCNDRNASICLCNGNDENYDNIRILEGDKVISSGCFSDMNHEILYLEPRHIFDTLMDDTNSANDIKLNQLKRMLKKNEVDTVNYVLEEYEEIERASSLLDSILDGVTNGRLIYQNNHFYYEQNNSPNPINLTNTASGLKNILVIQRLVKNGSMRSGDILIIDEPESNLHPKWQVLFAEVLVLLNKELHMKILINSHSPYFIRAIECKMAKYETLHTGKFYLMTEGADNGFVTEDVTNNTERIYKELYEPLEEL